MHEWNYVSVKNFIIIGISCIGLCIHVNGLYFVGGIVTIKCSTKEYCYYRHYTFGAFTVFKHRQT